MGTVARPRTSEGDRFRFRAGRPDLDFLSTLLWRSVSPVELLREPEDLARWFAEAGFSSVPGPVSRNALARAVEVREAMYAIAAATVADRAPAPEWVDVVNTAAREPVPSPQIGPDGGARWSAPFTPHSGVAFLARSFVELVSGPQRRCLKQCAARDCVFFFVDLSRARNRRWCSVERCGNREHVREHRARRADAGPSDVRSPSRSRG